VPLFEVFILSFPPASVYLRACDLVTGSRVWRWHLAEAIGERNGSGVMMMLVVGGGGGAEARNALRPCTWEDVVDEESVLKIRDAIQICRRR